MNPSISHLLLLASLCLLVAPDSLHSPSNGSDINPLPLIFNQMLADSSLAPSRHLHKCFTAQEDQAASIFVISFIKAGADSASSTLAKHLAIMEQDFLAKKLSSSTLQCLKASNDAQTFLLHKIGVDWGVPVFGNEKFARFASLSFYPAHYSFTNMSTILDDPQASTPQKYTRIGSLLRQLLLAVFGGGVDDPWSIRADTVQKMTEYFGISVSNGVIGAVSGPKPWQLSSTVLAGVYDKIGRGRVDNLVQTFPALNMEFYYNGRGNYYNLGQEVHMKEGSMTHSFSSDSSSVSYTYYALRNLPFVFLTDVTVAAHEDGNLCIKNVHQAPDHLLQPDKNYEQIDTSKQMYSILSTLAKTKTGRVELAVASSFILPAEQAPLRLVHEDWHSDFHLLKFTRPMKKGETFKFSIVTSLFSSSHHEDPLNEAIRMTIRAVSMDNPRLGHLQKWASLWSSDIVIEGNDEDQKQVRSMLYHCYAFLNEDRAYGVSPMGLSGLGYNGHVFWDMDLWIYPGLLALRPSLARNMIEYRITRLKMAQENAFINGYRGAMYPWESSQSGVEETPVWAMSGPLEHHISGCVAWAAWNYYRVTQDSQWLRQKGADVIMQVAEFFASRVEPDESGFYHIRNVVAADEWAENVDDDAFTNAIAQTALRIANKAARVLGMPEKPQWEQIAGKIVILKMAGTNVTREHSTYAGEPIKQADVNLLAFPLSVVQKEEEILRDLLFYEGRVPDAGTPAMTYSIFSLLYSRLRNPDASYRNFKESFEEFLKPPFNVFSETKGGTNPYFLTGAGGVLQSMVYGFGGLDITDQGLSRVSTAIPKQWRKVTIKVESSVLELSSQ